jgi:hypothetical protein
MAGRRCSIGCQNWPDEMIFRHCAICGELTTRINNIEPDLEREEAISLLKEHLFERYYERWCAQRGVPVDGPLPDEDTTEQRLLTG